jgi:ABC-type Mn2+/Zn2+ transport system permease subunit
MLILKRLCVWFVETVTEALLLGIVLALLLGHDQNAFIKDVLIYSSAIGLLFFTTGYLLSTVLVRAFWRGQTVWSYPAIATVLFLIHFEIMNVGVGGAFEPKDRLPIRVAGTCIAFICTSLGTLALRRWTLERSNVAGVPHGG